MKKKMKFKLKAKKVVVEKEKMVLIRKVNLSPEAFMVNDDPEACPRVEVRKGKYFFSKKVVFLHIITNDYLQIPIKRNAVLRPEHYELLELCIKTQKSRYKDEKKEVKALEKEWSGVLSI